MPFITLYAEMKILNGLGYRHDINELDIATATRLVIIKGVLNKLEKEEMESSSKKGVRRGR